MGRRPVKRLKMWTYLSGVGLAGAGAQSWVAGHRFPGAWLVSVAASVFVGVFFGMLMPEDVWVSFKEWWRE
jgi:hypothetical protein